MDLGIKGKRALVAGGSGGLAAAIAAILAAEGARVAVAHTGAKQADVILASLGGKKSGHWAAAADLAKEGQPPSFVKRLTKEFGPADIVVNCLEDGLGMTDPYSDVSDWRKVFRTNLEVAIELNNLLIPHMKKKDWGRIVNVTASAGMEHTATIPYCASKAALTAYTRCMGRILAMETGNVVMSAVLPGAVKGEDGFWVQTAKKRPKEAKEYLDRRLPLGRFGRPEEIASVVAFLCSGLATYCQGAIVPVDGAQAKHYFQVQG